MVTPIDLINKLNLRKESASPAVSRNRLQSREGQSLPGQQGPQDGNKERDEGRRGQVSGLELGPLQSGQHGRHSRPRSRLRAGLRGASSPGPPGRCSHAVPGASWATQAAGPCELLAGQRLPTLPRPCPGPSAPSPRAFCPCGRALCPLTAQPDPGCPHLCHALSIPPHPSTAPPAPSPGHQGFRPGPSTVLLEPRAASSRSPSEPFSPA